jgi:putative endonuclease
MPKKRKKKWSVYIVRCKDSTLYTGISNDVKRRVSMHNKGRGAKYIIPARRPVELVYVEEGYTLPKAMKREIKIKRSGKFAKEKLTKNNNNNIDPESK